MATEHVKVFEEKKPLSLLTWLLPLLLLLALLAWFLLSRHHGPTAGTPALGSVQFATNSAQLTPEDQTTLNNAANYLKSNPGAHLRVEGYTDATGTAEANRTLSQQRAYSVGNYLKQQGVEASRLTGSGFGADKPVDTNSTEQGKADNRRVELFQE